MRVGSTNANRPTTVENRPVQGADKDKKEVVAKDEFVSSRRIDEVHTYTRPKADSDAIAKLRAESERAYQGLRELVEQLLKQQGMKFRGVLAEEELVVDEAAVAEAQAAIADGGEYSAEAVSDRIVEFAKNVSGGDKTKLETLKGAIIQGFEAAKSALGGELPEISTRTYDLIMEKLAAWEKE